MIGYAQLILALSILVLLHELGHFIPAKLFKMRVLKFYLFFDPWFSVLKKKKGDTEYGIGWIPLGGYVKVAGMIDESMDKDAMELPPQPWEYRAKPAWQRLIMILGGVTVNIILAYVIFSLILFFNGQKFLPLNELKDGVHTSEVLRKIGFNEGDKIIALDGIAPDSLLTVGELNQRVILGEVRDITVNRNGQEQVVSIPLDFTNTILEKKHPELFEVSFPFVVDSVIAGEGAMKAGIQAKDKIISINGTETKTYFAVTEILQENKGKEVRINVLRNGQELEVSCTLNKEGRIGVMALSDMDYFYNTKTVKYGLLSSFGKGIGITGEQFILNFKQLKILVNPNGIQHMGSILSARQHYGEKWNWLNFWGLTAVISTALAFFNLLPIPGLDGGHAIFVIYELVSGRKPSKKFMEVTQAVGMILLLSLMFFALGNDIYNGNY